MVKPLHVGVLAIVIGIVCLGYDTGAASFVSDSHLEVKAEPETVAAASPGSLAEPETAPQPAGRVNPSGPPSMPVSETAAKADAALGAAPAPSSRIPADHWLVGTSDAPDMVPAVIAPEAPRLLLAEEGDAYLERIGDSRVLHLKGSYREMGRQHGVLLKEEILAGANLIKIIGAVAWKKDYQASIREAWTRTSPFIPQKYKDEMAGLAEAVGLSEEDVQNFTIFPELFHCSGFAVWGKATEGGVLFHGRVLDYMRDAGMDRYALVIVHEPEGGNAFVNIGYSGMLGSVTGMNVKRVAVGEMGGGGGEKWDGMPMSLLVRECLEKADTMEQVRQIMTDTPRTCQYYYCVSDSKADNGRGSAFGVAAEPDRIDFIGPGEAHPLLPRPFKDVVLMSAGDRYRCLADRVEKMYGRITPGVALDIMSRGVAMKSNMHNALFKPDTLEFWVANSTVQEPASNRPYVHYDLKELMKGKPSP